MVAALRRLCLPPGETKKGRPGPLSHWEMQEMPTNQGNALVALTSEAEYYLPLYPLTSHKGIWNSTQNFLTLFLRGRVFLISVIVWFKTLDPLFRKMHRPTYFKDFQDLWKTIHGPSFPGLRVWNSLVWISLTAFISPEDFKLCPIISSNHLENWKNSQCPGHILFQVKQNLWGRTRHQRVCFKLSSWF